MLSGGQRPGDSRSVRARGPAAARRTNRSSIASSIEAPLIGSQHGGVRAVSACGSRSVGGTRPGAGGREPYRRTEQGHARIDNTVGDGMTNSAVVVTGASSGIGRAAVELFAERGFGVVAVDVAEEELAKLSAIDGVVTLVGDVSTDATNDAAVDLALTRFGRLDVSVLNAGIGGAGPVESEGAIERFERILAVNVLGVASGIRAALPALRAVGGGSIVVTSSIAGLRADPGTWAYNASKAAVINLVRGTALDYAVENIRINSIAPGAALTGMTAGLFTDADLGKALSRRVPLQRFSDAREQAEAIWFLASPAASFITGVTLPVDGGLSASGGLLPVPTYPGESALLPR